MLKEWILWHVNYTSRKLVKYKKWHHYFLFHQVEAARCTFSFVSWDCCRSVSHPLALPVHVPTSPSCLFTLVLQRRPSFYFDSLQINSIELKLIISTYVNMIMQIFFQKRTYIVIAFPFSTVPMSFFLDHSKGMSKWILHFCFSSIH